MRKSHHHTPRLNLAVSLKRPFIPGLPRDCLRLIHWCLFFPQAIGRYLAAFDPDSQKEEDKRSTVERLRRSPVQRRMVNHALATLITWTGVMTLGLFLLKLPVNWLLLLSGPVLGICLGIFAATITGLSQGVAFAVAFGFIAGVFNTIAMVLYGGFQVNAFFGSALGFSAGLALNAAGSVKHNVDYGVFRTLAGGFFFVLFSAVILMVSSLISWMGKSITAGIVVTHLEDTALFSMGLGVSFTLALARLPDYLMVSCAALLFSPNPVKKKTWFGGHNLFLPVPGIKKQLVKWLEQDWDAGLSIVQQILSNTMQHIAVTQAIRKVLENRDRDLLPGNVAMMVDRHMDWDIIFSCTIDMKQLIWRNILQGLRFVLPRRKTGQPFQPFKPGNDTPEQLICSGFWYWNQGNAERAMEVFGRVNSLRHGIELSYVASAIHAALNENGDLSGVDIILRWEVNNRRLEKLAQPTLRKGTLAALTTLRNLAVDLDVAARAYSPLKRSKIAKRTHTVLGDFIREGKASCCQPEWELIKSIATKWRRILNQSGWIISSEELNQALENPYEGFSGLFVSGPAFVGRAGIMEKIEKQWAVSRLMSPLVVYGQRRIGKTSILKNLACNSDRNMLPVYISMQKLGQVNHTGQLLLHFARAIHQVTSKPGLWPEKQPNPDDYTDMAAGCIGFNNLLDRLAPRMAGKNRLVLTIDEFEVIGNFIQKQRVKPEFLAYLRALIQEYHWLGIIFAGLHMMDELGKDYQSAFYSQVDYFRVGYLDRESAIKLITQPRPNFPMEYESRLVEKIILLTAGQPYLIQRLCYELVLLWNDRFYRSGASTPRLLTLDDLKFVLPESHGGNSVTTDFFKSAAYYFDGIWESVTENERQLMTVMAKKQTPWSGEQLKSAVKKLDSFNPKGTLNRTLELLLRHDIIVREENKYRFASQLLCQWVVREKFESLSSQ